VVIGLLYGSKQTKGLSLTTAVEKGCKAVRINARKNMKADLVKQ